ncbi:MAG: DUF4421 domain-containing protein [Bacteroidaceae bacterium]|nr:DUF4421 domain-containing protein [Bacteroidaceae bacterium]
MNVGNFILAPYHIGKRLKDKADSTITKKFNNIDTNYITPNLYNYSFMVENSNTYEYFRISRKETNQSISLSPNPTYKIGAFFGWRWLFLGWTFDIAALTNRNTKNKTNFDFSIYTSKIGIDLYYKKTGNDFKITGTSGIFAHDRQNYATDFSGLDINMRGINVYYIFNHKKFSYPAAFSQSTVQRRSCGSWKMGFSYSIHDISFDEDKLPEEIRSSLDGSGNQSVFFNRVKYRDYSLSVGYAYNWVFAKNWLLGGSFSPAIAYKRSTIKTDMEPTVSLRNLNLDFITRIALVWNNTKCFAGLSLINYNYDYRKKLFSLTNGFGTLNIYCGFNFNKRKK